MLQGRAGGGGDDAVGWLYYFSPLHALPAEMRRDLGSLAALSTPFRPVVESNLWAGEPGISSPLHYDAAHNVFAQLRGTKRFLLFPPNASAALHVYPRVHPSTRQSQLDLRRLPPPPSFPRFHAARAARALGAQEVVLGPGDGLFIPAGCWHHVRSLSTAFSVSFWF